MAQQLCKKKKKHRKERGGKRGRRKKGMEQRMVKNTF